MSTIDIFRFSTLQVGTCRKCAKSQRKAWGSKNGSPDLCKHQKAKLRKSIEGRFLISASTTKETLQSRTRKRYRTKRRAAKSLKPIQRPSHSTRKTNSYYNLTKHQRRITVSKTLPKLRGAHHLNKNAKKLTWRGGLFEPMEINEEALIEHIFDICDEYGLGFIHRSTFLTTLKFNEEIQAAVTGSKVLKRLANEEAIQSKFMRFRTRHVQNMKLDELFRFLGKRPEDTHHFKINGSHDSLKNGYKTADGSIRFGTPDTIVSTALYTARKKVATTPPVDPAYVFSKQGIINRKLMFHQQHLMSLKRKLIDIIRYKIQEKTVMQRVYEAGESYKTCLKLLSSIFDDNGKSNSNEEDDDDDNKNNDNNNMNNNVNKKRKRNSESNKIKSILNNNNNNSDGNNSMTSSLLSPTLSTFNAKNINLSENLLLAVGPVLSATGLRIHTVDKLIYLYEKHKIMKAKIPRFHFLNYEIGENFRKSIVALENDLHLALGMGNYAEKQLSAAELKYIYIALDEKYQAFEKRASDMLWVLERDNWPNNYRVRMAATGFQNLWRTMKAKEKYNKKKKLLLILQNIMSKRITRWLRKRIAIMKQRKFTKILKRLMATNIQRCYRGKIGRRHSIKKNRRHLAAKRIQLAFKSRKLLMRLKKKARRLRATKKIQKAHRDMLVRIKYRKLKARRARVLLYKRHVFDQKVQDWKQSRMKKFATQKLQKIYRKWRKKKCELEKIEAMLRQKRNVSALIIQKNWRVYLTYLRLKRLKYAIRKLQRWHKAILDRWHFIIYREKMIIIQKLWRGRNGREKAKNLRNEHIKKQRRLQEKKINASISIQKEARRYVAVKKYKQLQFHTKSAVSIQRQIRGSIARKIKIPKRKKSIVTIQRYGRGMTGRRRVNNIKDQQRFVKRHNAATRIQTTMRGILSRNRVNAIKEQKRIDFLRRRNKNAILIQRHGRGYITRKRMIEISLKKKKNEEFAKELNERRKQASITIQKNARGRITRNNLNEKKRKQKEREIYAAIQIQKQGRGMLSRKHVKEKQQKILLDLCIEEDDDEKRLEKSSKENNASVKIQALVRGHLDRNLVERKKESNARENKAAKDIQRIVRGKQGRNKAKREVLVKQTQDKIRAMAAEDIQKIVRGHLGRLAVADLRLEKQTRARFEREQKAKEEEFLRKERASEKSARETMFEMEKESRANEDWLRRLADQAEKARIERQKEKERERLEKKKKSEEAYIRQRLEGMRDALSKAKDKESIEAIAFLIPDNEGDEFLKLKNEAMKMIKKLEQGEKENASTLERNQMSQRADEEEWTEAYDEDSGMTYYINMNTGETSWTKNDIDANNNNNDNINNDNVDSSQANLATSDRSSNIFERVVKRVEEEGVDS